MATTVPVGDGIPSAFYRNAIDLNRFSNSVSKKLVNSYNNVILKAVEQLEKIEKQPLSKQPAYKAARLRALIKQTKESLNTWAGGSVDELITELEGVAKVQAGFIEEQLKKSMPRGMTEKISNQLGYAVNSVSISPSFAKAVVNTDPTALNLAVLRSDLAGAKAPKGTFKLTAKEGQTITLPNGNTVRKSFLGIAQAEAKRLNQVVRTGLLGGQTTAEIVRDLVGDLQKDQKGSLSKLLAQGGAATKSANGQVMTIVRTTVNQVTNTASQAVYKANPDVTEEYRYVATLDSRTSPVCRDLDGQIFKYNEGPVPPQHFGCRSTTVAVINYKKWGFTPPPAGKRASVDGPVPANTTYGKWLYDQRKPNTKFQAGSEQIAALGTNKAKYFNRLANKYGPDQALKKLIREDNTEVSLTQLQKRYGKPEDIKKTVKAKPKPKVEALETKLAEIKSNEQYLKEAKANELKLKNLKSDFKKKTTKKIYNNDYAYVGEDFVKDEWVDIGNKRIKEMGYKIDNVMLDKTKLKGWSSEWEKLDDQIGNWKGGATSTQAAQCYNLQKSGAKNLSSYTKSRARRGANLSPQSLEALTKQANDLEEFVSRAPTYDGKIMRGMKIPKKDFNNFIDDLAKGKSTVNLESWSADLDIAEDFAGLVRKNGKLNVQTGYARSFDNVHVITTVNKNKYGASIRNLADDYQHENEVLIPSGIRYRLVDLKVTPIGTKGHEAWEVVLEQL